MTTTGPTSTRPITHTAELVERHRITVTAGQGGPASALDECRFEARQYATAHGFELGSLSEYHRSDGTFGIEFDVVVGKGNIDLDQTIPGVLDSWVWSGPRAEWWRKLLARLDRSSKRLAPRDGLASVTALPRANFGNPSREVGCTCAIGGPFVDICPVHYRADQ